MIAYTNEEWLKLQQTLQRITMEAENSLQHAERSFHAVQDSIQQIKAFILDYTFKDRQEEIHFFKEVKPMFLKELIYFMKVFYIEAAKPLPKEAQITYYKQTLERVNDFFERNHSLYIYYRMGKSNADEQFFVRGAGSDQLEPEYSLDIDPRFSTIQSFKFGKIQAYETLNEYLQQAVYLLENPTGAMAAGEKKKHRSFWTDNKASLIELAYAIHSRGSVNNGQGDVKQLIRDLETLFHIEVGNFYRTFQSMRIRKKNRTPFLDTLKDSLEKRMDETDLNFS